MRGLIFFSDFSGRTFHKKGCSVDEASAAGLSVASRVFQAMIVNRVGPPARRSAQKPASMGQDCGVGAAERAARLHAAAREVS